MNSSLIIQNSNVFYTVTGNGLPVMLVHGFGEDSTVWKYQVEFFKDKCKLIIPDLPGSGKSGIGHGSWFMEDFADVLKEILDKENISSCIMIGHSMGGYITMAFEEKYPAYLKALGLFHSSCFADNEEKKQIRQRGIEFIQQRGAYAFLQQSIPNLFAEPFKKHRPGEVEALIEAAKAFSNESLIIYYRAMMQRPDRSGILKHCVKPVLLISGEEDKAVSLADSLKQASFAEQSLLKILPQVGHMGMWEATDMSNQTIEQFIELVNQFE